MNKLNAGFSIVNANPPLGIGIAGYYVPRFAKGFLNDIEARSLALSVDDKKIVIISLDNCYIDTWLCDKYREQIAKSCGIAFEDIFLTATHTHTGPLLAPTDMFDADVDVIAKYADFVGERLIDSVKLALADLKPAKMGYITGWAPERVAYIRRYRMKDGSTMTCPPVGDPNIDHPLGELDQRVHVLRFDREGAESIVFVNYGLHVDCVNGEMVSADWPSWMYSTLDKALDGVKTIFVGGAQGDVGSTHVFPEGGDMNDTEISFDNEMKSPGMSRFVGRAIAGTVLQVYDKVNYVDVDSIKMLSRDVFVSANVPDPKDLPLAHKYKDLHDAGRDDEIPYKAMELTTVVAEAIRMCTLENGPKEFCLKLTGISLGDVALVGIPGEPFTDIGVKIKDTEGFDMIMPCCLTNGSNGYFPNKDAFDEGGYEARSSSFKGDVAEKLVAGGKELLNELKK
ncbi:MAG: hypothetical protein IJE70_01125 [Oscillospiraceae bacterium]|nr:hypothetical protein [Oscillospiraceae bacterium]